jgi:hypothetical protein
MTPGEWVNACTLGVVVATWLVGRLDTRHADLRKDINDLREAILERVRALEAKTSDLTEDVISIKEWRRNISRGYREDSSEIKPVKPLKAVING